MKPTFEELPAYVETIYKVVQDIKLTIMNLTSPSQDSTREVLTVDQIAEYLSLSKSTIYSKVSEGTIPYYKKGKRLYFSRKKIDHWLMEDPINTHNPGDISRCLKLSKKTK